MCVFIEHTLKKIFHRSQDIESDKDMLSHVPARLNFVVLSLHCSAETYRDESDGVQRPAKLEAEESEENQGPVLKLPCFVLQSAYFYVLSSFLYFFFLASFCKKKKKKMFC